MKTSEILTKKDSISNQSILTQINREESSFENSIDILNCFDQASKKVSPLWDIRDYVAVNPFFGFRSESFLETTKYMSKISDESILPECRFFLQKYESGEITDYDLEVAKKLFEKEVENVHSKNISTAELVDFLKKSNSFSVHEKSQVKALSEVYDLKNSSKYTPQIVNEVSRWLSVYFDEGQATWKINSKERLYTWWKSLAKYDQPFSEFQDSFKTLLNTLPDDPNDAFVFMSNKILKSFGLGEKELIDYYYKLIYTILGWSSFVKKFEFEADRTGDKSKLENIGSVIDIVTIRLAYDFLFLDKIKVSDLNRNKEAQGNKENEYLYIWLNALENVYRRNVEKQLKNETRTETTRPEVQMAFCIDVRSEVLRRHLEATSEKIQTIGFAGFFGMPISVKKLGQDGSDQNCPILLNSSFELTETSTENEELIVKKKKSYVNEKYFKKNVQSSANSGFSFVETMGLSYIGKILKKGLGRDKPNLDMSSLGLSQDEKANITLKLSQLSLEDKVTLSFNALKNMGINKNLAKFVFFFGHGSETSNNPFASALECGACAGHNGQSNAELLARILNDSEVQSELLKKGVEIPSDSVFLSGWHNTVKDDLNIDHLCSFSNELKEELTPYINLFETATLNCRQERAQYLPGCKDKSDKELAEELFQKANDWSEVRPEWGLARNASFIVARRSLTRNLDLNGRSFLHDYDYTNDKDLSILELIMTAPMIVTNWINMQYYASTVNPLKFGAGNKAINNVVGTIGCIQGNESDLLGGLTEQSVLYQGDYFHEPIRLQVFIEQSTSEIESIIHKHDLLKDLIFNNWLKIISINPENKKFKLYQSGTWIQVKEDLWN